MGAVLDLAPAGRRDAGDRGQRRLRQPADFADTGEALSGGNFHAEPVAFAADMLAIAVCEIGSLAERRVAMLIDPALSGLPAFLTPQPGLNSGFMMAQVTAAALVAENKQRAIRRASIRSRPPPTRRTTCRWRRTARAGSPPWRRTPSTWSAIELLAAAQGCDFHAPLRSSAPLERVRARLRERVPRLEDDRYLAPDMAAAAELVRSGALAAADGRARCRPSRAQRR